MLAEIETIDNSLDALACAIRSTAGGEIDDSYCGDTLGGSEDTGGITGGFIGFATGQTKCSGFSFGEKCIDCSGEAGKGFSCRIEGFELPQDHTKISTKSLAEKYISGVGDPKYLMYYEKFPADQAQIWQFEPKTMVMVGLGVRTALMLVPFAAKPIAKGTKNLMSSVKLGRVKQLSIAVGGKVDDVQRVTARRTVNRYNDILGFIDDKVDDVGRLELRGIGRLVKANANSVRALAYAPDDLVDDLAVRLSDRALWFKSRPWYTTKTPSKGLKTLTAEGKKIIRQEIDDVFRVAGLKPDFKPNDYVELYQGIAGDTNFFKKSTLQNFISGKSDLRTLFATQSRYGTYSLLGDELIDDLTVPLQNTISDIRKSGSLIQYKNGVPTTLTSDGQDLVRTQVQNIFRQADLTPELQPHHYKELYESIAKSDKLAQRGALKQFLTDRSNIHVVGAKMAANADDVTKLALSNKASLKGVAQSLLVDNGKFSQKNLIQVMERTHRNMGNLQTINPEAYKALITRVQKIAESFMQPNGAVDTIRLLGTTSDEAARTLLSTGGKYGEQVAKIRNLIGGKAANVAEAAAILTALGVYSELQKKDMQKFIPVGKNSLGFIDAEGDLDVQRPIEIPRADQYYLNLIKRDGTHTRFFVASPCKTDYVITEGVCACEMNYGGYVYQLPDGKLQPIEPPQITNMGQIETIYVWDKLSEQYQKKYLALPLFFGTKLSAKDWVKDDLHQKTGLGHIRQTIELTPGLLEEYHKVMFKKPHEFLVTLSLMHKYNGEGYGGSRDFDYPILINAEATLGKFKGLIKINSFNDEEFREFQKALIEFYGEAETERCSLGSSKYCYPPFVYYYGKNGISEKIEIPKLWSVLDPTKGFILFPIGELSYYKNERHKPIITFSNHIEISPGQFWYKTYGRVMTPEEIRQKEQEDEDLWMDSDVDWQERVMAYTKVFSDKGRGYTSFPRMMAYRFYHSEFFNNLARESAYHYYVYNGDTSNVVKKCEDVPITKYPPGAKEITRVPCLTFKPEGVTTTYRGYNGGKNFCYYEKNIPLEITEDVLTYTSIAAGILLMGMSGGGSAIAAVTAIELASMGTTMIVEFCGGWPSHSVGLRGCFT